jgi:hypothetical protein
VNKKGLPVWKLAYFFSVYIILPENTHQYVFTAADNSPLSGVLDTTFVIKFVSDLQQVGGFPRVLTRR